MSDPVLPKAESADCSDIPDDVSIIPPAKKRSRSANAGRDELNLALASACREYTNALNTSSLTQKARLGATVLLTKVLHAKDEEDLLDAVNEAAAFIDQFSVRASNALNMILTNKSLALL